MKGTRSDLPLTSSELMAIHKARDFANTEVQRLTGMEAFELFQPVIKRKSRPFLYAPEDDWNDLRRWLKLIHDHGYAPPEVRDEVCERVKVIHAQLTLDGVQADLNSVRECCSYAVWLLIKGDGALGKRLVCCDKCGSFDFNERVGKGRTRRDYCNKRHRKQLSVWKATHPDVAKKRRRPEGPWQRPWPKRGPLLK